MQGIPCTSRVFLPHCQGAWETEGNYSHLSESERCESFPRFVHAPRGPHGSPKGTQTDKKDLHRLPKKFRMTSESHPMDPQSLPKDPRSIPEGFQKRPQRAPKDPKGISKGPQQLHRPGHLINKSVSLQKGRAQNQSTRN